MYKIYIVLQGCRAYSIKDMFQVCTGAVDCVALWTRTSSKVWTCFKNDPKIRKTKHFFHRFGHVSHLWQRQKHCSQWDECSVWVLGRPCCRNHMKQCLTCTKTSVYYGEYMMKNARDQGPGRNNLGAFFIAQFKAKLQCRWTDHTWIEFCFTREGSVHWIKVRLYRLINES